MRDRLIGEFDPNGFKDGDVVNTRMAFSHILPSRREDIIGCDIIILGDTPERQAQWIGCLAIVDCNLNYDMVTYRVNRF